MFGSCSSLLRSICGRKFVKALFPTCRLGWLHPVLTTQCHMILAARPKPCIHFSLVLIGLRCHIWQSDWLLDYLFVAWIWFLCPGKSFMFKSVRLFNVLSFFLPFETSCCSYLLCSADFCVQKLLFWMEGVRTFSFYAGWIGRPRASSRMF